MYKSYKRVMIATALKSGRFIKASLGRVKEISYKGRINLVTDVDKKSEEIIIDNILSAFPGHSILSEESGAIPSRGDSSQVANASRKENCPLWIIDPLDGTTNFAHGFPFFSVSIGLEKNGKVIMGVVYDPVKEELFFAEREKGAYLNNKRIKASAVTRLSEGLLATGFMYGIKEARDNNIRNFSNFLMRAQAIRRAGSAALDFCYVACGRFDGYWELDLKPWDCAAGALIVKEAGGAITRLNGSLYSHYDREVLATNGLIHKEMVKVFKAGGRGRSG